MLLATFLQEIAITDEAYRVRNSAADGQTK